MSAVTVTDDTWEDRPTITDTADRTATETLEPVSRADFAPTRGQTSRPSSTDQRQSLGLQSRLSHTSQNTAATWVSFHDKGVTEDIDNRASVEFFDDFEDGDYTSDPSWEILESEGDFSATVVEHTDGPVNGTHALRIHETTGGGTLGRIGWSESLRGWRGEWRLAGAFYTENVNLDRRFQFHAVSGPGITVQLGFTKGDGSAWGFNIRGSRIEKRTLNQSVDWSADTWYRYEVVHNGNGNYTGRLWQAGSQRPTDPTARSVGRPPATNNGTATLLINGAQDAPFDMDHAFMRWKSTDGIIVVDDDGGPEVDYRAIQPAVENASDDSRIKVRPGIYRESVKVNKNVTIFAPNGAILNGSGLDQPATGFTIPFRSNAGPVIHGFTITGFANGIVAQRTDQDWQVHNLTIQQVDNIGINAEVSSGDWRAENIDIQDSKTGILSGFSSGDWVIKNSSINNSGVGVNASNTDGTWKVQNASIRGGITGFNAEDASSAWSIREVDIIDSNKGINSSMSRGDWTIRNASIQSTGIGIIANETEGAWTIQGVTINKTDLGLAAVSSQGNWRIQEINIKNSDDGGINISRSVGDWTIYDARIDHRGVGIDAESANGDWLIRNAKIQTDFSDASGAAAISGERSAGIDANLTSGNWILWNTTIQNNFFGVSTYKSDGNWMIRNATLKQDVVGLADFQSTGDWDLRNTSVKNNTIGISAESSRGDWNITDTTIVNNERTGLFAGDSRGDWNITDTTIVNNARAGIDAAFSSGEWTINNAIIKQNQFGVRAQFTSGSWDIHKSTITDNSVHGVNADGADPEGNATQNWWGQPVGPAKGQCVGNVDCGNPLLTITGPAAKKPGGIPEKLPYDPASSWTQFANDTRNTGHNQYTTGPKNGVSEKWTTQIGGKIENTGPVVAENKVFVANDDGLYALDAATGEQIWSFNPDGSVKTGPAVDNGTVYAGIGDYMYAIDAKAGMVEWKQTVIISRSSFKRAPTVTNDRVYIAAGNGKGPGPEVVSLDATDGEIVWKTDFENDQISDFAPAIKGDIVVIGAKAITTCIPSPRKPLLFGLDAADGSIIWGETYNPINTPTVAAGSVLSASCIDISTFDLNNGDKEFLFKPLTDFNFQTSISAANKKLFVGFGSVGKVVGPQEIAGGVLAIKQSNGEEVWRTNHSGVIRSTPAVVDDVVYFGGTQKGQSKVYAVDGTEGDILWEHKINGELQYNSPAVVNGTVYITSDTGKVYALSASEEDNPGKQAGR